MIWLQRPKCEYLLVFLVFFDIKLNIFEFLTVGRTKQDTWICFNIYWHIIDNIINRLMDKVIILIDSESSR